MSLKRYATRRDKTEPAILQALASVGAKYLLLDAVDVLALYKGRVYLLECKTPKSNR
jgi:Holliday junction resolvase